MAYHGNRPTNSWLPVPANSFEAAAVKTEHPLFMPTNPHGSSSGPWKTVFRRNGTERPTLNLLSQSESTEPGELGKAALKTEH